MTKEERIKKLTTFIESFNFLEDEPEDLARVIDDAYGVDKVKLEQALLENLMYVFEAHTRKDIANASRQAKAISSNKDILVVKDTTQ